MLNHHNKCLHLLGYLQRVWKVRKVAIGITTTNKQKHWRICRIVVPVLLVDPEPLLKSVILTRVDELVNLLLKMVHL